MRILYIADARSPIALSWIASFLEAGHEVHVVSSFPASAMPGAASFEVVPVGLSALLGGPRGLSPETGASREGGAVPLRPALPWLSGAGSMRLRASVRHWLGPATIAPAARRLQRIFARVRPELVHALRLPMEGMLAAAADPHCPLLISLWGNDLTLHAPAAPGMRRLTRKSLRRADGLHADSRHDLRLAGEWAFPSGKPQIVLPGNGGVRLEVFHSRRDGENLPRSVREVLRGEGTEFGVNPRGFRGYVRSDTFFRAAARLGSERPGLRFLCPAMAGEWEAERWLDRLGIGRTVRLLPRLQPVDMAAVFRLSAVSLSPSEHDGTPNTLLEAMACGAFPICGNLESIREWIDDGVNGLLVDPRSDQALAAATAKALDDSELRRRAAERNQDLIRQRAERRQVFTEAEAFCRALVEA